MYRNTTLSETTRCPLVLFITFSIELPWQKHPRLKRLHSSASVESRYRGSSLLRLLSVCGRNRIQMSPHRSVRKIRLLPLNAHFRDEGSDRKERNPVPYNLRCV
ncbi:hypothetical protein RRG08_051803 [Elysia crispata]|uniref:Uncharacterized protein n=1 Tax=Elysia crispata TaxID=231223 RepID=A0AAE1A241_9GAST|nr:hypothetical protein RRG08_051803 [Elysia crispata]